MNAKTKLWNHFVCCEITSFTFKEILVQMKAEQNATIKRSNQYNFFVFYYSN